MSKKIYRIRLLLWRSFAICCSSLNNFKQFLSLKDAGKGHRNSNCQAVLSLDMDARRNRYFIVNRASFFHGKQRNQPHLDYTLSIQNFQRKHLAAKTAISENKIQKTLIENKSGQRQHGVMISMAMASPSPSASPS